MNIDVPGVGVVHTASIKHGLIRAELEKELLDTNPEVWIKQGLIRKEDITWVNQKPVKEESVAEPSPEYPMWFRVARQLYLNLVSCTDLYKPGTLSFKDFLDPDRFPETLVVSWYEAAKKLNGHWWNDEVETEVEVEVKKEEVMVST